jgi:hypothetical protein
MANKLVLIADLEASRKIEKEDRTELQQQLRETLDKINQKGEGIESPYTITLGDEFQAIYEDAEYLFVHFFKILAELHPVTIRFSTGIGSIDTPINTEQAIGMDGPAFHEAREGMEMLKESGFLFNIRIEGEENSTLKVINGSLKLIGQQIRDWNKKRFQILYMLQEGHDYKSITKELGISRAAFYKNKEAGLLDIIDELSNSIAELLNQKLG